MPAPKKDLISFVSSCLPESRTEYDVHKYLLHIHVLGIAQLGMHKDEMSNLHDTSHGTLSLGLVGGKSLHWPNPTTTLSGATSGPCTQ